MKLYFLERKSICGWDETDMQVIRARSSVAARKLANTRAGDEGPIWTDTAKVVVKVLKHEGAQEVICISSRDA